MLIPTFFKKLQNKFRVFIALIIFISSTIAQATPNKSIEKYEPSKIWLAIPASAFVGFGLGYEVQDRYADYGWIFTGVDTAALALGIFNGFGDCAPQDTACSDNRNQRTNVASALWIVSRVVQTVDVSLWGYQYHNKFRSNVYLVPTKTGISLAGTILF